MIALLDIHSDLTAASQELGCPCEQLLTPLTQHRRTQPEACFAIDNGAFAGFKAAPFRALLEREDANRSLCRFVVVPDVVGSARRTLEVFEGWKYELQRWPLELAIQDGQQALPIPWPYLAAVFIGGTTAWKVSENVRQIIRAAQALGKWVHVGRVNTAGRWDYFEELGVDSLDGTGLARFSHMRHKVRCRLTSAERLDLREAAS